MKLRHNIHLKRSILPLFMSVLLAGCSDSPTDPVEGGGIVTPSDNPDIPQPTTLGGDVPATSSTLTRISLLGGVFRPNVLDAYGGWEGTQVCNGTRNYLTTVYGWSSELRSDADYGYISTLLPGRNIVFQDESGSPNFPVFEASIPGVCNGINPATNETRVRGGRFGIPVYVRRDRHWQLRPLEGDAGSYLLVYPQTTGEVSTTYTSGIERGETIEFGKSLTIGGEVRIGPLSGSIQQTLSQTFSTSVIVSESKAETFKKTVSGKPGKVLQFMVWELVEEYRFCDAEGNQLVSEDYIIAEEKLTIRGTGVALQSTEFELP